MRLETFFGKFEQVTDAPNAVEKMRELVLNLAVQGRLVQQDAADEDVEHLLTSNDKARRATAKSDRRADADNLPLLSADDRWEIAETWSWRALADLVLFVDYRGKTPIKLSHGIRLLTAKNVRKGEINLSPEEFLSEEEYHAWMTRGFPKAGDVLFTTEAPMGNAAVVKLMDTFALAQRVICFQSYGAVDSSFLVLQILSRQFQFILDKNGTGVTAKGIKASKLKHLPIALPPLAEQKRIVAKVDELMALCDRLEAQQQERDTRHVALARAALARFADAPTPANLDLLFNPAYVIAPADIRKTILTLTVQGKLVPQDSNDEPGEAILQRIRSDASSKRSVNDSTLSEDLGELPFDLPNGWSVSRLGSILLPTRGISYGVIKLGAEPQQGGVFILRCSNVRFRKIDLSGIRKVTEQLSSEYARTILEGGEVLINVRGTLGGCAVVPPSLKGYNIAREVAVIPVHSEIDATFLLNVIASPYFQDRVDENLRGIAYEGLNLGLLRDFLVPIPPLAEQRRIVAKVDQLMALVDQLEAQLAASRAAASNLMEAVVAELTSVADGK